MLFDSETGQLIPDNAVTEDSVKPEEPKAMNPLDKAAMLKAMAAAKGKDWAKVPQDGSTEEIYHGVGSEPQASEKDWEPISSADIAALGDLGVKF